MLQRHLWMAPKTVLHEALRQKKFIYITEIIQKVQNICDIMVIKVSEYLMKVFWIQKPNS